MEPQKFSFIAGGNAKWYSYFGRQFVTFYETKHTLKIRSRNYPPWYLSKGVKKKNCLQIFIGTFIIHNVHNMQSLAKIQMSMISEC